MPAETSSSRLQSDIQAELAALREKVEALTKARLEPAMEAVAADAQAAARAASDSVRERPLTALALAALGGFVAALLVRR